MSDLAMVDAADHAVTAAQVSVVGELAYGESRSKVAYTSRPRFRAFKLVGGENDRVELTVKSTRTPVAYLVDASFAKIVATGSGSGGATVVSSTLGASGTYYVIFRDAYLLSSSFDVTLAGGKAADACTTDADCAGFADGAQTDDVALCQGGRCELVDPNLVTCGGDSGRGCAAGWWCAGESDGQTGVCRKLCAGIGRLSCDAGFECVDDADDDCDPQNGGRDCHGLCQPKLCGGLGHLGCASGFECVDDTSDDCDVNHGGRDCAGLCVKP